MYYVRTFYASFEKVIQYKGISWFPVKSKILEITREQLIGIWKRFELYCIFWFIKETDKICPGIGSSSSIQNGGGGKPYLEYI